MRVDKPHAVGSFILDFKTKRFVTVSGDMALEFAIIVKITVFTGKYFKYRTHIKVFANELIYL